MSNVLTNNQICEQILKATVDTGLQIVTVQVMTVSENFKTITWAFADSNNNCGKASLVLGLPMQSANEETIYYMAAAKMRSQLKSPV